MRLLFVFVFCSASVYVNAEQYVCSATYDDGSGTLTSTIERVDDGYSVFFVETSPYVDSATSREESYLLKPSYSGGGMTIAMRNGQSLSLMQHDGASLNVYFLDFETMGFTERSVYGGKYPLTFSSGEVINEDMNKVYRVGSCVKRD